MALRGTVWQWVLAFYLCLDMSKTENAFEKGLDGESRGMLVEEVDVSESSYAHFCSVRSG